MFLQHISVNRLVQEVFRWQWGFATYARISVWANVHVLLIFNLATRIIKLQDSVLNAPKAAIKANRKLCSSCFTWAIVQLKNDGVNSKGLPSMPLAFRQFHPLDRRVDVHDV